MSDHHLGAIEDICDAVIKLNSEGEQICLELFGVQSPLNCSDVIQNNPYVMHRGTFCHDQKDEILAESHLLIIPFTFDADKFEHYRLSFPTKVLESIATGIPSLFYGPKGMGGIDFCLDKNISNVICDKSVNGVYLFLKDLMGNYSEYETLALNDKERILGDYSNENLSRLFQNLFVSPLNASSLSN